MFMSFLLQNFFHQSAVHMVTLANSTGYCSEEDRAFRLDIRVSEEVAVFRCFTDHQRFLAHRYQREEVEMAQRRLEKHMMAEGKQAAKLAEAEQNLAMTEHPVARAYTTKHVESVQEEMDKLVIQRRPFVAHLREEEAVYRGQEPFMQVKPHLYRLFAGQVGEKPDAWVEFVIGRVIYHLCGGEIPLLIACKWEGCALLQERRRRKRRYIMAINGMWVQNGGPINPATGRAWGC